MDRQKWLLGLAVAGVCIWNLDSAGCGATMAPGGSATHMAIASYESWMQFAYPDDNTPAVDQDGCLNYALAKMAVRYHLPVQGVDILDDAYTYYTTFAQTLDHAPSAKLDYVAALWSDYLTQEESIWLTGDAAQRMEQAYAICVTSQDQGQRCYILEMTTASGSSHYVLTDYVDTAHHRLYLLDSGSRYVAYLGDAKTVEKGYTIMAVHPFELHTIPGDVNADGSITLADAQVLSNALGTGSVPVGDLARWDADHSGDCTISDVIYLTRALEAASPVVAETEEILVATATTQTAKQPPE